MSQAEYEQILQRMRDEAFEAAKRLNDQPQSNVIPFPSRSERWSRQYTRPMGTDPFPMPPGGGRAA